MLEFTEWMPSDTPPVRPGLYVASAERDADRLSYWTGERWSALVDIDAPQKVLDATCMTPLPDRLHAAIEWRGLTADSAAWLAGEMARDRLVVS